MTCYHARVPVRLKEGFAFDGRDAVASYEGAGYLTIESGDRMACEFRADQDNNGVVQLLCYGILPTDFAFHLLPLMDTGGSAGFRGTTRAGATDIAQCTFCLPRWLFTRRSPRRPLTGFC